MERVATVLVVIEPDDQACLSEPLAGGSNASNAVEAGAGHGHASFDLPLASMGRLVSEDGVGFVALPAAAAPTFEGGHAPPEHGGGPEPPSRVPSMYGIARSFYSQRFSARGHLYQAFAQFDLDVLQPRLGGPCHMRLGAQGMREPEAFDMQNLQGYADQPGFARLLAPPSEEETPAWSRSVIFE